MANRATHRRWKAFPLYHDCFKFKDCSEVYFDFSGIAAPDVHRHLCGRGFYGVRYNKGIGACGQFCESEDPVFIGFLVLVGFENMNISVHEGFPCASLINSALNIACFGYNREWYGDERK